MGDQLAILVPVLARPHRVKPLLASIARTTHIPYRVVFLADPDDTLEQAAVREAHAQLRTINGGYAHKIRDGVSATSEPLLFFGADDLEFQPGWFDKAKAYVDAGVQLVGVNDMIDRANTPGFTARVHATHFLTTRAYAERPTIDGKPGPLSTAYRHWCVDDELIGTAKFRGVYAYAPDACVAHRHYLAGGEDDDTYRLGRRFARRDKVILEHRRHLWASRS